MGLVWVWGKRFVCLTASLQVDGPVYLTRFGTVSEFGSVCMLRMRRGVLFQGYR
jgi:hypothetical protein